jgi:hypothetical protein
MNEQTILNLFEAFLQTAYLSPEDLVDLLRIPQKLKKDLAIQRGDIRNEYLDNLDNGSEEQLDEYIDKLYRFIK